MFLVHTSREHAEVVARAVVGACRLDGWQSPVQPQLLHTLFNRLLGQDLDFEKIEPLSPAEVAGTLSSAEERQELIHLMVAIEMLCNPLPERLERLVVQWATVLHVHERALVYARELARGELMAIVSLHPAGSNAWQMLSPEAQLATPIFFSMSTFSSMPTSLWSRFVQGLRFSPRARGF